MSEARDGGMPGETDAAMMRAVLDTSVLMSAISREAASYAEYDSCCPKSSWPS